MAVSYTVADDDRPALTLAELEAFDPYAPPGGRYRRFHCPLCDVARPYRSLSVEVETGGWNCWRCGAKGKLREHWQTGISRRDLTRVRLKARLSLAPVAASAAATDPAPVLAASVALAGTPGAAYVESRGIPLAVAEAAGVLWSRDFYGRPAVLFPIVDRQGQIVAVNWRYLDAGTPKTRSIGPKSLGVFCTPGALAASPIVICEAPLDALSLHACGVPAVALVGTTGPDWLRIVCGLRRVALALDADEAGALAAEKLGAVFGSFGSKLERWRPEGAKDWNEALQVRGRQALCEELHGRFGTEVCHVCGAAPASYTRDAWLACDEHLGDGGRW